MNASSLIQKVWNFCHTLRDDGVGYGDYLEQLTYPECFIRPLRARLTYGTTQERA